MLGILIWLMGCDPSDRPVVVTSNPQAESIGFPITSTLSLTFSHPMDSDSMKDGLLLINSDTGLVVPATITVSSKVVTLDPTYELDYASHYSLELADSIESTYGKNMDADSIAFATEFHSATSGDPFLLVGPAQLDSGSVSVTLDRVGSSERIRVIPFHGSQKTLDTSSDGIRFEISASGLDSSYSASQATAKARDSKRELRRRIRVDHLRFRAELRKDYERRRVDPAMRAKSTSCDAGYVVGATSKDLFVYTAARGYEERSFTLMAESDGAYYFVDDADLSEFDSGDYATLESLFEDTSRPTIERYFGDFPDLDGNCKLSIALSSTLIASGQTSGIVGYVAPSDLDPDSSSSTSNHGDYFYLVTPRGLARLGYSSSDYFNEMIPGTMTHELKHLVADAYRIGEGLPLEDNEIEEPSAVAAEELAGVGTQAGTVQPYLDDAFAAPEDYRLLYENGPETEDETLAVYGYGFLWLWRLGELAGHDGFWSDLIENGATAANSVAWGGYSLPQSMTEMGMALGSNGFDSIDLGDGTWETLEVRSLRSSASDQTRSFILYEGRGTAADVQLTFSASDGPAYFLVVRQ